MPEKPLAQPDPLVLQEPTRNPRPNQELRVGDPCPQCPNGRLDYDGLLNLACPICGYALGGCFT